MQKKKILIPILLVFLIVGFFLFKEYQKKSWSDKAPSGMFVIAIHGGNKSDEISYLKLSDEIFSFISKSENKGNESDIREEKWGNPTWHRLQFPVTNNTNLNSVKKICNVIVETKKVQPEFANLKIIVIDDKGNKY